MAGILAWSGLTARVEAASWQVLRRRFHRLREASTRAFPVAEHGDLAHVYVTYLSPALVKAEARAWGRTLERSRADVAARVRAHLPPRELGFQLEFSVHRWPWLRMDMGRILAAVRLEVDGRSYPVHRHQAPCFDPMLRGRTRTVWFRTPEGEPQLPGPSAKVIRLVFPGLETKRSRGQRLRDRDPARWFLARVSFPPEAFGDRWQHPLPLAGDPQ
jgi:hypothetical protein